MAAGVWSQAELIVKVKEPVEAEYEHFRPGLLLYTYLHLAPLPGLTQALARRRGHRHRLRDHRSEPDGVLPLLVPMSEIAGRMSVQVGAHFLERANGGRGVLLGGVPGVNPADVVIIGGGIVGRNAARMAYGLGAHVTILDRNPRVLQAIDDQFDGRVNTIMSHASTVECVERPCGSPRRCGVGRRRRGAEGGLGRARRRDEGRRGDRRCRGRSGRMHRRTTRGTTHADPTFVVDGVVHYGVTNMPGAVPRTSTFALTNVTTPYLEEDRGQGCEALRWPPTRSWLRESTRTRDG